MRAPRPLICAGKACLSLSPKPVSSPSGHRFSLWLLKQAQKRWSPLTAAPTSELRNKPVLAGTRGASSKQDNFSICCIVSAFILGWKSRAFHFASPGAAVSPWAGVPPTAPWLRSPAVQQGGLNGTGKMLFLFHTCGRWIKMIVAFFASNGEL